MKQRSVGLCLITLAIVLHACTTTTESPQQIELEIAEGEFWWVGVTSESHLFPIDSGSFEIDLYGNTAGNQVQPLLISSAGRYIWSDDPFRVKIAGSLIQVESDFGSLESGMEGETLRETYQFASKTFFPPSGDMPDPVLFTHPQFNTWIELTYYQNQVDVLKYAHAIVESGFEPGVLMIDEGWANDYGDWTFNLETFPDPKSMMDELHALGFKVMLWVSPYISPDGAFFKELFLDSDNVVWIRNPEHPEWPAILQWWDGFSAVVDLTSPSGVTFLQDQLDKLVNDFGVDGFKLDGGDAVHYSDERMLNGSLSFVPETLPNEHTEAFARFGLNYKLNEYRATWKMGGQALAQRLRDKGHNWEDLRTLVPGIINQGLMGYPFTCPDLIGGGEYLSFRNIDTIDQELIVRAAQAHALMPMMQFSVAPWRVLDSENLKICVDMADLHTEMGSEILALAEASALSGEPIIRPLEYAFPQQGYVGITDQFLLGNDILVAPVVEKGATSRVIQFPPGSWLGDDGSLVEGPAEITVDAPLERLPWYQKQ